MTQDDRTAVAMLLARVFLREDDALPPLCLISDYYALGLKVAAGKDWMRCLLAQQMVESYRRTTWLLRNDKGKDAQWAELFAMGGKIEALATRLQVSFGLECKAGDAWSLKEGV